MDHKKIYQSFYFLNNKKKNYSKLFLADMNKHILSKTITEMKKLEMYGINPDYCNIKKFQNGIWKIRTKDNSNNVRLFFYIIDNHIYYLYGFYKKTQKTPAGEKVKINNLKINLLNHLNNLDGYVEEVDYNFFNDKV